MSISIDDMFIPRSVSIGEPATITLDLYVDGRPSNDAMVDYFILNKDGRVITSGKGTPADSIGEFKIELSAEQMSRLSASPNQLRILTNSIYAFRPNISERTILAAVADDHMST